MTVTDFVAAALTKAGVEDVYTVAPSMLLCDEPVVCGNESYEREVRARGHERGVCSVDVLVARRSPKVGYRLARACEAAVRQCDWKGADASLGICGMDCGCPKFKEVDQSGRWVWCVTARATVEARDGE